MNDFCKIFETEKYGQILILIELEDDKYQVSMMFWFKDGTVKASVCGFKDIRQAESYFNSMDEDLANEMMLEVFCDIEL